MLIGNRSGGGTRQVKVLDDLSVGTKLCVGSTCITEAVLQRILGSNFNIVLNRPLFDNPTGLTFTTTSPMPLATNTNIIGSFTFYGLFNNNYALPPPTAGATRKYRLYAVYTDNVTSTNSITVTLNSGSSITNFNLANTWGGLNTQRDYFTAAQSISDTTTSWSISVNVVPNSSYASGIAPVATAVLYYLELQALDVFSL